MVDRTLSYLDYVRLLELINKYSSTPYARESVLQIKPFHDPDDIVLRQEKIEAVVEVHKWDGPLPLSDTPDIRETLKRLLIRDSFLESGDFLLISDFLKICGDILRLFKKAFSKRPFIEEVIENINPLSPIYSKIVRTVNAEGFIEDTASYDLSRIRADLFIFRERIRKQLERVMERENVLPVVQDTYIAIRNGRYVVPLKPNFNQFIQGIVHDYSHSLKTSFVEPVECVELNNSINILEREEEEEEKRILKELTDQVRAFSSELEKNLVIVSELDLIQSLAAFSIKFNCVRPVISRDNKIDIRGAKNPFISLTRGDKTVAIDIFMDNGKNAMIISGPNAGGKTAALKTIGLLSLMAQSGLFIPAQDSPRIPVFSQIFAVVGDEQDISMELSSFTAHMTAIKEMYEKTKGGELILIDEIGGSTEPQEASALSMGILDAFIEKGCRVIVTTHLNLLKAYGYTQPFAINVSTAYDAERMEPLYRLSYGIAGYSNAINVARNINIPARIIEKSCSYMGTQEQMFNELVTALELGNKKVEEERQDLKRLRDEFQRRLALLKDKRDEYIRKVEEKCVTRLTELEEGIEDIKKEIAKKEKASIKISKERLNSLRDRFVRKPAQKEDNLQVGDYVSVRTLGSSGYITEIDKERDICEVVIGNVRTKVNRVFISKAKGDPEKTGKPPGKGSTTINVQRIDAPQLNLIGMRVEEALRELDRFIDRALVQGMAEVKIIHGFGTGRLMNAVREHLTEATYVKGIHRDEKSGAATIVELS